ncbi:MAG: malate dehydrogenase, partial [Campylobacteraceae bacterium]|nr:malate dehydrogenase [Campylobacteraceae bacterium]
NPFPIIFALANPTPEIMPEVAHAARNDIMMGTGRSDYPNQVNNVLGFPFIFRGALDVRATKVTEGMKMAAAVALAKLAKEEVPQYVRDAYNGEDLKFGMNYIIPKPFDRRVLVWVSAAVAEAAIKDGVAKIKDFDIEAYKAKLQAVIDAELK